MNLAIRTWGEGPQITLVHGWGLGAEAWSVAGHLLGKHFTVHSVALPGYGESPPQPQASLDDLADALAATLPPRSMLCGWSLGALVCMAAAVRHPRRVARLVLVGATASFVQREGWQDALPAEQLAAFKTALERAPAALLKQFSTLIHVGDVQAREAMRALRGCLAAAPQRLPADPETLRAGLDLLGSVDLRDRLDQIDQPTLLIHGNADPLMPIGAGERLLERLPSARLQVFEGNAHAPFASDPLAFVRAVCAFAGVDG